MHANPPISVSNLDKEQSFITPRCGQPESPSALSLPRCHAPRGKDRSHSNGSCGSACSPQSPNLLAVPG